MKTKRNIRRLSTRQRNKLFKDIEDNPQDSYYAISKRNGVTTGYVSNLAREKFGREKRAEVYWTSKRKWTPAAIDQYLTDHDSTIKRITKSFKHVKSKIKWRCTLCNNEWMCCFDTIMRRVETNLSMKGCPHCGYDSATLYHDFLDELTHESAYFLGVFYARGSVQKGKTAKSERLVLTSNSKEKLEKIQGLLASTYTIKRRQEDKNGYYVRISSPKLISKLKEYKAVNSKCEKPKSIPKIIRDNKQFFPDFLRGYMDCVGYVEIINSPSSKGETARVNIPAKRSFAQEIQQFHKKALGKRKVMGYITSGKKGSDNQRAPEWHMSGTYAVYEFLKLVYNSSVSPIKYMSQVNYNKFLQLQHKLVERAERNEKIRELAERYEKKMKKAQEDTVQKIANRHKVDAHLIYKIKEGYIAKKLKAEKCNRIRAKLEKSLQYKKEADMIVEEAVTLTGMKASRFKSLGKGRWRKTAKYTDRVDKFKIG